MIGKVIAGELSQKISGSQIFSDGVILLIWSFAFMILL